MATSLPPHSMCEWDSISSSCLYSISTSSCLPNRIDKIVLYHFLPRSSAFDHQKCPRFFRTNWAKAWSRGVKNPGPKNQALGDPWGGFNALSSLRQSARVTKNSKSQISNNKQITMTKIQNSKPVLVIWYWNLRFVCNLVLGVWDFIDSRAWV